MWNRYWLPSPSIPISGTNSTCVKYNRCISGRWKYQTCSQQHSHQPCTWVADSWLWPIWGLRRNYWPWIFHKIINFLLWVVCFLRRSLSLRMAKLNRHCSLLYRQNVIQALIFVQWDTNGTANWHNVQIKQESPAQSRVGFVMLTRSLHFSHCRHWITNTCHLLFSISICHHSIIGRLSVVPKNSSVISISLVQFQRLKTYCTPLILQLACAMKLLKYSATGRTKASMQGNSNQIIL